MFLTAPKGEKPLDRPSNKEGLDSPALAPDSEVLKRDQVQKSLFSSKYHENHCHFHSECQFLATAPLDCPTSGHKVFPCQSFDFFLFSWLLKHKQNVSKQTSHFSKMKKAFSQRFLELVQLRYHVKTTLERCGPFSLVVLSQRRSQVTPLSGHSDQNASETFSNKLQLNKVQSSLRQTSAKTTQVRSKAKTS